MGRNRTSAPRLALLPARRHALPHVLPLVVGGIAMTTLRNALPLAAQPVPRRVVAKSPRTMTVRKKRRFARAWRSAAVNCVAGAAKP